MKHSHLNRTLQYRFQGVSEISRFFLPCVDEDIEVLEQFEEVDEDLDLRVLRPEDRVVMERVDMERGPDISPPDDPVPVPPPPPPSWLWLITVCRVVVDWWLIAEPALTQSLVTITIFKVLIVLKALGQN